MNQQHHKKHRQTQSSKQNTQAASKPSEKSKISTKEGIAGITWLNRDRALV
jgi:hypothetical protein